jgi:hypothetical protein
MSAILDYSSAGGLMWARASPLVQGGGKIASVNVASADVDSRMKLQLNTNAVNNSWPTLQK